MRHPLGTRRHGAVGARSLLALVLVAVLALALAPTAYAGSHHGHSHHAHGSHHSRHSRADLHKRARHVHHKMRRVAGALEESSTWVLRATARLRAAERRLTTSRRALSRVYGRLEQARSTAKRVQGQLDLAQTHLGTAIDAAHAARERTAAQDATTASTVIDYATAHNPGVAAFQSYLSAGSLDQLDASATAEDIVVGQERIQLAALQARQRELEQRQAAVRQVRDSLQSRRAAVQRTVVRIRGLVQQVAATRRRYQREVVDTRRAHASAVHARAADRAQLRHLRAQEARIKRRILAASARAGNRHIGNTHGMFEPPVWHSYITSPYGWRIHPIYHYWGLHDGDDLHAPCGRPERAVGWGKVLSQYYSDVWGHRLYLGLGRINGHNYVAIYNHISAYRSRVGQRVRAGQTIALAGTTGWSTGCHLHFTLMRDGRTVDPAPYIGM